MSLLSDFQAGTNNYIINGGFDFWQRGTTGTNTGDGGPGKYVSADRWKIGGYESGVGYATASLTKITSSLPASNILQAAKMSSTTAGNDAVALCQIIESQNAKDLAGKKATLSFWVKRLTSATDCTFRIEILYLNSADTAPTTLIYSVTGATVIGYKDLTSQEFSTSWSKVSLTVDIPSGGANGLVVITRCYKDNLGISDIFAISDVMLNEGSQPAPFRRAGLTYGGELALCQRYYEKSFPIDQPVTTSFTGTSSYTAVSFKGNSYVGSISYAVIKRTTVTPVAVGCASTGNWRWYNISDVYSDAAPTIANTNERGFVAYLNADNTRVFVNAHWTADAEL